jgi:hypothetical protein
VIGVLLILPVQLLENKLNIKSDGNVIESFPAPEILCPIIKETV